MMAVALTAIMDYENKSNTPGQEEDKLPDQEGWKEPDQSHVSIEGPSMGLP